MKEQDWNSPFQDLESNAWAGTQINVEIQSNVADLGRNDWASLENLPERGQGRSGRQKSVGHDDASELGSRTKPRFQRNRSEGDDRIFSKSRDDELSRSQQCSPRSTAAKTRVHQSDRDCLPPDLAEEEFNLDASQILEFEKQVEEDDAFGTMFVASTTSRFRKSLERTSSIRRKDNAVKYEYEEPVHMTFEKKEASTRRSLDVGGDKIKASSGHNDLVPKRSGPRTPRRSSIGALSGAHQQSSFKSRRRGSIMANLDAACLGGIQAGSSPKASGDRSGAATPGSMSNQHVTTETYSADISVLTAPVDAHPSSSKSRRRSSMAGSTTTPRRKENSSKYEYEEPGDMTFGKKEPTGRSLDVGGDESKRGSGHDDLGPKRSGRTPRRQSMGALSGTSMPGSISNQHVTTETYSADVSVLTAPVDAHPSSSKSRRRSSMAGSTATPRRKENSAKYEYEEPGDMTFGKKEPTGRSLDVGGDESKRGSGHDDLGPKRSGRTPRRQSMGALSGAAMPGSMSNQHVTTETYSADVSVLTAPVDAHPSSSKSRRRSSMAGSTATPRRKENSAKYEYEEPGDMTFGKKESTDRSLDVGGDESKWGSGHDDLGPKVPRRSGRTPRRQSMGALSGTSMPASMSNQHVTTETYSVGKSVLTAPVDAHPSSSKSRRRGSIMASLDASLENQTDSCPKASGGRPVYTSVTEARKNRSYRHNVEEEYDAISNDHDVSEKDESKEHHRPCRRSGPLTQYRARATRRSSIGATLSDSHDMHGVSSPVDAQATEPERTQKDRSSRHRGAGRRSSIGCRSSPLESSHGNSSDSSPPHQVVSRRSSIGDASRTLTGFEAPKMYRVR